MGQRGPYPEGTLVCLIAGGPLMTVEDIAGNNLVHTVWFDSGVCHRDVFHPTSLRVFLPAPTVAKEPPTCG